MPLVMPRAHDFDGKQSILDALKECRDITKGKRLHAVVVENGDELDVYVGNSLVTMYSKCKSMSEAERIFQKMRHRTTVTWNALIFGYADNGDGATALERFAQMVREGFKPSALTFVAALKACTILAGDDLKLKYGLAVHSLATADGPYLDIRIGNILITMYGKCSSMVDAHRVFERMSSRDAISWNALMFGYVENGKGDPALRLFSQMQSQGFSPDSLSLIAALKACVSISTYEEGIRVGKHLVKMQSLEKGIDIHFHATNCSCFSDIRVPSTLIDMYGKCGSVIDARVAFDGMERRDIVSWNALMFGYADNGEGNEALDLFRCYTCSPNALSFVAAFKACGTIGALEAGKALHMNLCTVCEFPRASTSEFFKGLDPPVALGNSLLDCYGKCGCMEHAQNVFDSLGNLKNVTTWNILIGGYSRQGNGDRVLEIFHKMQEENITPTNVTFVSVLAACNYAGLVVEGKENFEVMSSKFGIKPQREHYCCMVDILSRANELHDAMTLLKSMPFRPDAVIWTAVLDGCRKWQNARLGRLAFETLLVLEDTGAVLLANMYVTDHGSIR